MTNGGKFKTAKERSEAYALYCASMRSSNLPILHNTFDWLELEYDVALRVCPFCGGEAVMYKSDNADVWYVSCNKCGVRTEGGAGKEVAIAAWNRRV